MIFTKFRINLIEFLQSLVLINIVGGLSGCSAAIFILSLDWATDYRENHRYLIYGLPIIGFLIGYAYHKSDKNLRRGSSYVIEEAIRPKKTIPLLLWPLIFFSSVLTHLFGGSAGREGAALQMGGTIGDNTASKFKMLSQQRRAMILMGMAASFGALFGTPLAASLFVLEVIGLKKKNLWLFFPFLLATFIADRSRALLQIQPILYSVPEIDPFQIKFLVYALILGTFAGLVATFHVKLTDTIYLLFKKLINYPPLRPTIGGIILLAIIIVFEPWQYIGLGVPTIQDAFTQVQPSYAFVIKIFLTALTLGCGFRGGEVIPLFFIGATLGSALSAYFIDAPLVLFTMMGFVAAFAGGANTPIACAVMSIELFHVSYFPYALIACLSATIISSRKGLYTAQPAYHWKLLEILDRRKLNTK